MAESVQIGEAKAESVRNELYEDFSTSASAIISPRHQLRSYVNQPVTIADDSPVLTTDEEISNNSEDESDNVEESDDNNPHEIFEDYSCPPFKLF